MDVEVAAEEAAFKAEVGSHRLLMVIVLTERENLNIRRRQLTRKMERRLRITMRKSKVGTKRITRGLKKLMKILITTDITTLPDLSMKEFKSPLIPKFQHYLLKKREKSNQIRVNSTRK